jgi:hypothetical protein
MSLADDILNDAALFLSSDDFATAATYKPGNTGAGTACKVVVNESDAQLVVIREGQAESREAIIAAPSSVVVTPHRGDSFVIASGPHAGTWMVNEPQARDAGITSLRCRLETTRNTVAENAIEVRQ